MCTGLLGCSGIFRLIRWGMYMPDVSMTRYGVTFIRWTQIWRKETRLRQQGG